MNTIESSAGRMAPVGIMVSSPARATVRIPMHRRRLAFKAVAAFATVIFCCGLLLLNALGKLPAAKPWHFAGAAIALASGLSAWLRATARLQDSEAGLIVAPGGLTIRSEHLGRRIGRIPWSAIAGFKPGKHNGRTYIAVLMRDPARWLADLGLLGGLLYRLRARVSGSAVVISTYWLDMEPGDLEALLAGYLTRQAGAE